MVKYCSICKIEQGMITDVSFHKIPNNPEMKTKWVMNIGQELSNYNSVCSRHFEEKDFYYKVYGGNIKRFLIPTAVPSYLLTQSENSDDPNLSLDLQYADNIQEEKTSRSQNSDDFNDSNISLDLQYADNIQKEKTSKRKLDEALESKKKKSCKLRYIGDLSREHFTSNNAWNIVKEHAKNCRRDKTSLTAKIKRATKKIESLQSILNNLRKKGILCGEVCNQLEVS